MAYPTADLAHATEAVALLTDHYRTKTVIPALLKCYVNRVQELENAAWAMINAFLLANSPVGDQLNCIGTVVGCARGALSDADYLNAIKLQIRVNRSQGLAEDILQVCQLYGNPPVTYLICGPQNLSPTHPNNFFLPEYLGPVPSGAASLVECQNVTSPAQLIKFLGKTRSMGTYNELHYTTWAPGNDFVCASVYGGTPPSTGKFGSAYTTSVGGPMVAGAIT